MDKPLTRTHYIVLVIASLIPFIMVLTAFPFIPDPMPAHFSLSGDVNRWGSRYEALLLPVIAAFSGLLLTWATRFSETKDDYMGRLMFFITLATVLFLIVIEAFVLYMTLSYTA
ncbi:MAG: DUF1648 domain-containing protein [Methanomassiliicoccaceae archaeon]|nr:DUF1648 domain-containing protein [Methanomassiliicoccaceae archaeon]